MWKLTGLIVTAILIHCVFGAGTGMYTRAFHFYYFAVFYVVYCGV